jgi:hypothetical protein
LKAALTAEFDGDVAAERLREAVDTSPNADWAREHLAKSLLMLTRQERNPAAHTVLDQSSRLKWCNSSSASRGL